MTPPVVSFGKLGCAQQGNHPLFFDLSNLRQNLMTSCLVESPPPSLCLVVLHGLWVSVWGWGCLCTIGRFFLGGGGCKYWGVWFKGGRGFDTIWGVSLVVPFLLFLVQAFL